MKERYYLAYGSNLNLGQMEQRCPSAIVLGATVLKDYKLEFRRVTEHAYATVSKAKASEVPVLIWKITAEDEVALDLYEDYPSMYSKELVEVEWQGRVLSVMIYIMNPIAERATPSEEYFNTICEGYESALFARSILEKAYQESLFI
ncbi:gamma-glutamylcyclotransferase family protein [Vagococcus sp.]|uniref:gamma-glutamylcyclotransferase family protein n=1 Tax=Vagococcus sp. TaxID=1933889 RepID=UPI003F9A9D11